VEEIAKFRAARRLWAHIMRDRFGATHPRAMQLRFHTQTAGSTLTAQQPDTNIARVAIQALAAVLGGTQSLHCNGRDEALALPTEESAQIALRTQQILASDTGVADTVDPVAGSWVIEEQTDRIEHDARALIDAIDAAGGTLAAIERGWIQRRIQDAAYSTQRAIDRGEQVIVGLNRFIGDEPVAIPLLAIDPAIEARQCAAAAATRAARDETACQAALAAITDAARGQANLMPVVLDAVERRATLGEIADAMRVVFGSYRDAG
jgi:methylmalonyl-CoA mutase N-terminal domain/subunit